MFLAAYFLASFFLGAIPNAYLAGRLLKNIDIRSHGSGNVGATNVFRVLGRGPGIAVFGLDFLKGALPVLLFAGAFPQTGDPELLRFMAGLSAVFGHMFTPFLGFKGGKGIATGAGALCAAFPPSFLVALSVWIAVFLASKTVSLSSLTAVLALFISGFFIQTKGEIRGVFLGLVLLVFWSHRANIGRLLKGQEHRFSKQTK